MKLVDALIFEKNIQVSNQKRGLENLFILMSAKVLKDLLRQNKEKMKEIKIVKST